MSDRPSDTNERLERYIAGDMSSRERAEFDREILDNPELASLVYADVQMQAAITEAAGAKRIARAEAEMARESSRRWWQLPAIRWAIPAGAALVIAMFIMWSPGGPEGPGTGEVFRGIDSAFAAVAPAGAIAALPSRFEWTPHPDAVNYRFELFNSESRRVHSVVTPDTFVAVDATNVVPVAGYWTVTPLNDLLTGISSAVVTSYEVKD